MQVWIGTSGYSYPDWVGPFYPEGTRPQRMLVHYCRHFPLVELNFTFYHPPEPGRLARFAEQTPDGFQFIVKLPRTLSHDQEARDLPGFRRAAEELRQRGRLLGLLCQLPQSQHCNRPNLDWLDRLAGELDGLDLAVEFRHRSWQRPEVQGWLEQRRLALVSVDVPDIPALYPRGLASVRPFIYVRWHSRSADNWYASDKERYDFHYDDEALGEWVRALASIGGQTERAFLLFNNCMYTQAVANAQRMRELITRLAPELTVVEPPSGSETPRQRLLFDEL